MEWIFYTDIYLENCNETSNSFHGFRIQVKYVIVDEKDETDETFFFLLNFLRVGWPFGTESIWNYAWKSKFVFWRGQKHQIGFWKWKILPQNSAACFKGIIFYKNPSYFILDLQFETFVNDYLPCSNRGEKKEF